MMCVHGCVNLFLSMYIYISLGFWFYIIAEVYKFGLYTVFGSSYGFQTRRTKDSDLNSKSLHIILKTILEFSIQYLARCRPIQYRKINSPPSDHTILLLPPIRIYIYTIRTNIYTEYHNILTDVIHLRIEDFHCPALSLTLSSWHFKYPRAPGPHGPFLLNGMCTQSERARVSRKSLG